MARQSKKRKFSNNQPVVFRYGVRKLVGTVVLVKPIGKKFIYDVLCEDGKVYSDLLVDSAMSHCIDTYLTRLFYQKYNLPEDFIPEIVYDEDDENAPKVARKPIAEPIDEPEEEKLVDEDEVLYVDEDADPNY